MTATKAGWYVRVCSNNPNTGACELNFYINTPPNQGANNGENPHNFWTTWYNGCGGTKQSDLSFDLPANLQFEPHIWLGARPIPGGAYCFCLCYQNHVVRQYCDNSGNFDEGSYAQTDTDSCNC